jgi:glucose 1-dehydrogenase
VNYVTNPDAAEEVAADIGASAAEAIAIHADDANEAEVQEIFAKAITRLGTIDILVNNAGLQRDAKVPFDVPSSRRCLGFARRDTRRAGRV